MSIKRKLLRLIKKALETEEEVIPIYSNHCALFSGYLDLDPELRRQLTDTFIELRDKSREHKEDIENLIKKIEG